MFILLVKSTFSYYNKMNEYFCSCSFDIFLKFHSSSYLVCRQFKAYQRNMIFKFIYRKDFSPILWLKLFLRTDVWKVFTQTRTVWKEILKSVLSTTEGRVHKKVKIMLIAFCIKKPNLSWTHCHTSYLSFHLHRHSVRLNYFTHKALYLWQNWIRVKTA